MTRRCAVCETEGETTPCPVCGTDANVGRVVGERFSVAEALGTGGMGSIYRAKDERLGETVAIKFLKRALGQDFVLRERFRREALSLAQLRHPGIVTVLDFGEDHGELYIVLELVHGRTLEDVIADDGPLPSLRAATIFDQVLAAIETCHQHDIVHRDLKPSNLMIASMNDIDHVKVIDFGLARLGAGPSIDKLTETGAVHGTPHYMAPEQCRGEEVGPPADIYALGVTFYQALSGAEPFRGADAATFMAQHLFADPPDLRRVAPHVPIGVASAIRTALAKQPVDRPTARELRAALTAAYRGTDPETMILAGAAERRRLSAMNRNERALTGRVAIAEAIEPAGHATVWMKNDERTGRLRGALGVAGIASSLWESGELPCDSAESAKSVLVVSVGDQGLERVAEARAADPTRPILLIDVHGLTGTTAAIRAGASDLVLLETPDAEIGGKIHRLLRKRRR